ncbi:MAG: amidohydrolase family protein [Candidatus Odyssella sp.]|nr:amidohydrolase family protein [Candidatus Odyssella sp.]
MSRPAAAPAADIVVAGGVVVTMDPSRRLIRDGAVAVAGNRIVAVGKRAEIESAHPGARVMGGPDKLVFPGLIDGHNHPIHFLSKGMIDDMRFPERWRNRVWPYEAGLSPEEARLAATGTFLEMIRRGTTCFADPGTFQPDAIAEAAAEIGIRGVVSRMTWDVHDPTAPAQYNDDTASALGRGEATIAKWHGAAGGRIRASFSLVRSAHVTEALVRRVKARADALGVMIHAHLATTRGEMEAALRDWGITPVERYRRFGVLGPNAHLVHMGFVSDEDIATLKAYDASVCHCPSASMFGGFGCVSHGKFPEMVAADVRVVLGTDACAVSRFLDMVRIMYLAACAHKDAKTDPTVIGAHKAMEMATIDAARALLWDRDIGSIEAGKCADIVVADTSGMEWQPNPFANPVANLIYSSDGGCVETVLIDGRPVLENGRFVTIDAKEVSQRAGATSNAILARMGVGLRTAWPCA